MLGNSALSETPLSAFVVADTGSVPRIAGYTKTRCGTPDAGWTVKLFRTSTDVKVATTTSDATGYYEFLNPSGGPFYARASKTGSPYVGTTAGNLIPA